MDNLPIGVRLIYWALIIVLTGNLGIAFGALAVGTRMRSLAARAGFAVAFGLLASALTVGLSLALLPAFGNEVSLGRVAAYCFFSATPIYALIQTFLIRRHDGSNDERPQQPRSRPRILDRDPALSAATTVWALSAQDHYVLVQSDAGQALILMRFADAIAECEQDLSGVQIHRSHWVAHSLAGSSEKKYGKPVIHLPDGKTLPISRRKVRELSP